jgi:hypothetical protein
MAKNDLFVQMPDEFLEAGKSPLEIPSPQTFFHVWRNEFPHLKIPYHNTLEFVTRAPFSKKKSSGMIPRKAEFTSCLQSSFKEIKELPLFLGIPGL